MLAAAAHDSPVWNVLFQLLAVLGIALIAGVLFERFRQSAILGYLVAGMIVGPGVLGVVSGESSVSAMAELGVSLLLFAIGLEFSAKRLLRLGPVAVGGGSLQVMITLGCAAGIVKIFGLEWKPAFAVGAAVALSSTACVLRLLIDQAEIDSVHGRTALGILLLQDVAVVPLVLLVSMLGGGGSPAQMGIELAKALGLIIVLVAAFLGLSRWILPMVLRHLSMSRDRELLVLLAVVLAIGSAWSAHAFHLSPALGAFAAGMMLAESPFANQIRSEISSLRILFVTLFFTSVGMLGDPVWISQNLPVVLLTATTLIVGKGLIIALIASCFRIPLKYAFATGATLSQVGEFGIVIAGIAKGSGLFDEYLFHLIVSATLVSLFLTPYLVRYAIPGGTWLQSLLRKGEKEQGITPAFPDEVDPGAIPKERVIIVGFGPSGRNVGKELLRRENTETLVIDFRQSNVDLARSMGLKAEPGDATSMEYLLHHGIERANAIVISIPDHQTSVQIVRAVRAMNSGISIIVRGRYHSLVKDLEDAGATQVIDEEYHTGKRLASAVRAALSQEA
ncbi:MAG: cation:proton antiporter [Verrucomicrobiales bacterium]|nr:cation:proton antiporter [Verrucomicrobiales bacterium]